MIKPLWAWSLCKTILKYVNVWRGLDSKPESQDPIPIGQQPLKHWLSRGFLYWFVKQGSWTGVKNSF